MCKYCDKDMYNEEIVFGAYIEKRKGRYSMKNYLVCIQEDYKDIPINYCPMCGKELKE